MRVKIEYFFIKKIDHISVFAMKLKVQNMIQAHSARAPPLLS